MDRARAMTEILELSQYTGVEYSLATEPAYAVLQDLETPEGWTPDRIRLRFEFPEEFPEYPPYLYAPEELEFRGGRPTMLAPPRQDNSGEWCPVSLGHLTNEWDPDTHSLSVILSQFLGQLTTPVEDGSERVDDITDN
jgi:hypothetical protein